MSHLLTTVLDLHARDLWCIPIDPASREPLVRWGFIDTHGHPDGGPQHVGEGQPYTAHLFGWWDRWPDAGAAVLTGRSRLLVIDTDPRHGGDSGLLELCAEIELPTTFTVATRHGGLHLYYRLPLGVAPRRSSTSKLAPGIDVLSAQKLAVTVPTPGYRLLDEAPIAEAPIDLLARCPAVTTSPSRVEDHRVSGKPLSDPVIQRLLTAGPLRRIAESGPGQRHDAVFREACRAFQLTDDPAVDGLLLAVATRDVTDERYVANYAKAVADARRRVRG